MVPVRRIFQLDIPLLDIISILMMNRKPWHIETEENWPHDPIGTTCFMKVKEKVDFEILNKVNIGFR